MLTLSKVYLRRFLLIRNLPTEIRDLQLEQLPKFMITSACFLHALGVRIVLSVGRQSHARVRSKLLIKF